MLRYLDLDLLLPLMVLRGSITVESAVTHDYWGKVLRYLLMKPVGDAKDKNKVEYLVKHELLQRQEWTAEKQNAKSRVINHKNSSMSLWSHVLLSNQERNKQERSKKTAL